MERLLEWYDAKGRSLPWRETRDPYAILVSEVMLQQTQVDRVVPKYVAWLEAFPDWEALARAPRVEVLRLWSGLGYNSRAVRLQALAKLVVEELGGRLPETEEGLRKLPGVGPYTAGALMVFAHNTPGKCVDVNVERVIKRVFFTRRQRPGKKTVEGAFLASFPEDATAYGNALMDFGSTVCTASKPKCDACPLFDECKSRGERPEERKTRAKKKQSAFLHSNRWWRGRIIRALTAGPAKEEDLLAEGGEEALAQLTAEGIVERKEGVLRISDARP